MMWQVNSKDNNNFLKKIDSNSTVNPAVTAAHRHPSLPLVSIATNKHTKFQLQSNPKSSNFKFQSFNFQLLLIKLNHFIAKN